MVDWPDMGVPVDEDDAFDAVCEAWHRARLGQVVDVACDGGTGRTGSVLACLVARDTGCDGPAAVAWVREHHHRWAVEGDGQEQLVDRFAAWLTAHPDSLQAG